MSPAAVEGRLDDDRPDVEVRGETQDHITLLAEYASIVAEREGSRPQAVLQRASSRAARRGWAD